MKNKKSRKKTMAVVIVVVIVAVIAGSRVMNKGSGPVYEEVAVEERDITTYLEFSGNVEAVNVLNVYPDTSARVLEVFVEEGDEVKAGDVIALLDSGDTEYNISLKEASLELTKLQNSYNIKDSETNLENLNTQIANGENSSLNTAQKSLLTAQENYQDAADAYNEAKVEYESDTADKIVSAKESLRTAELNYELNMANLEEQRRNNEDMGQDTYNYEEQKAVYENTLAQARADLDQAREDVKEQVDDAYEAFLEAERSLADAERDYETTLLSVEQNVESSQASLEKTQALANVESSELELAHLKESLEDFTVYAPIEGFVTELNMKEGETVGTGVAVAEIMDLSTMQAAIQIDEYDAGQVSVGDGVQVYINSLDKTYEGKIASISKKAIIQSDVSYLEAVVEFDAEDDVSSGLSAEIKLIKADERGAAAIPVDAVQYESDNTSYVLRKGADGEAVKAYVTLGVSDGNYVQIVDGVSIGDIILTLPSGNPGMAAPPLLSE